MQPQKTTGSPPARRAVAVLAGLVIAVVAIELVSLIAVGVVSGTTQGPAAIAPVEPPLLPSASQLSAAQASLSGPSAPPTIKVAPSIRVDEAMAYDAKDKYVVLFGGNGSGHLLNDTWKFSGGSWSLLHLTRAPPAGTYLYMTYDAKDGYVVLNDNSLTWTFTGGAWTGLSPHHFPSERVGATMTFDAKDGYVLFFGGYNQSGYLTDTWKFVAGAWSKIATTSTPPGRAYAGMTYDMADGYVVLFGGCHTTPPCSSGNFLGDTWTYSGGTWTQIHPTTHPAARGGFMMTYDSGTGSVILFGGCNSTYCTAPFSDTWSFVGGQWSLVTVTHHPSPRLFAVGAYDVKSNYLVLFGGENHTTAYNDTWEYTAGSWSKI
jgi:Galactose oxidase, central domain